MIFQCQDLERALRSPELMPDARAHAETCERCRADLYLWGEISRLAPGLHRQWESPELWERIRADLAEAAPRRPKIRPVWRWSLAAAAAIALAALVAQPWGWRAHGGQQFLTEEALKDVQQAEAAYVRSIDRLWAVARPSLEESAMPLAAAYREKLVLLDSAIADLKANAESNRYNLYLQNQLASLYREKQQTLEEWVKSATIRN
jgi:hypothetical protein